MILANSRVGVSTAPRLGSGTVTCDSGSEVYLSVRRHMVQRLQHRQQRLAEPVAQRHSRHPFF